MKDNPLNINTPLKNTKFLLVSIIFIFFLVSGLTAVARAATLYLLPQSQNVYKGDSFLVEVRLDSGGEGVNAAQVNLNFPTDLLEIVDFNKGGSIFSFWVIEPKSKDNLIFLTGGIPGGFKGDGLILKINFLAEEIGEAKISFNEDSKVLLNDGKGTPAKLNFLEGNYEVVRKPEGLPIISSRTHPDQNKWYKETTLHLHWDLVGGAEYSFLLSKDSLTEPDEIPDKPEGELIWMGDMEYPNLEDGIYYFSLKQKLPGEDWSKKITFRAMIDSTSPENFKAEIGRDPSIFEGKYFLSFITIDEISGIDYYEILEADKRGFKRGTTRKAEWKKGDSPYLLEDQSLQSKILVKAVDKAGNEKISEILPTVKPFPYLIVILVGLVVIVVIIYWLWKKYFNKRLK